MATQDLPTFLATLGKTELKPGGSYATGALLRMLGLKGGEQALVMGPRSASTALFVSMATSATTEALVADESDDITDSDPALRRRSTARVGKAEQLPFAEARFEAVLIEGILAGLPAPGRTAVLKEVRRVLKPGGRLGVHELCWRQPPTPRREAALQEVWGAEVRPHVVGGWWEVLEGAGFSIAETEVAGVSYFTRKGLESDEGEAALDMFHAAFATPERLARFAAAIREFTEHRRYYGAWIARAIPT
jgi:SAM-dependent methyltransferase